MKVLNLYAGIGGNRKLWENVEVTAIEFNPEIAELYRQLYPKDNIIVCDAHKYLLHHYQNYDFIWSSIPCPSHSRARYWGSFGEGRNLIYPDMALYQEILFLKHYCKTSWVVENVIPYYDPLIKAQKRGRHLFWANFHITEIESKTMFFPKDNLKKLQEIYGVDLSNLNVDIDKRVVLRNMVNPELGKHILECARAKIENRQIECEQPDLFL